MLLSLEIIVLFKIDPLSEFKIKLSPSYRPIGYAPSHTIKVQEIG